MRVKALGIGLMAMLVLGGCTSKASSKHSAAVRVTAKQKRTERRKAVRHVNHGQKRIPVSRWHKTAGAARIPILMYHDINVGNSLQMPPKQMQNQLHWLKDAGYYFLSPDEAYVALTQNKLPQRKVVWVTFDDGYKTMYTHGLPMFKQVGAYVTINEITDSLTNPNHVDLQQLRALSDATGTTVNIESHTVSHLDMNKLPMAKQMTEMSYSRGRLQQWLHTDINTVAYPAGHYNRDSVIAAQKAGYKMALTTKPGLATAKQGLLQLHRVRVNPGLSKNRYLELVQTGI
ncbi:polysaccharide deacetylase family protein [Lacticaseibacillus hulanensis]|uniref:polysaccharide deacetylase family protein n=1 Tax=Lacticaseibacillus hulanensis TaxID=2493111 RepID=UPI001F4ED083|nr:polysaccharide deacetylase family protein [Lacticaseibacillus hulanensis]